MELQVQMNGITIAVPRRADRCSEFSLGKGEIFRINAPARPVMIQCLGGVLWVTNENDPKDYLLQHSESVSLHGPGRMLIQALPHGKMCIITE